MRGCHCGCVMVYQDVPSRNSMAYATRGADQRARRGHAGRVGRAGIGTKGVGGPLGSRPAPGRARRRGHQGGAQRGGTEHTEHGGARRPQARRPPGASCASFRDRLALACPSIFVAPASGLTSAAEGCPRVVPTGRHTRKPSSAANFRAGPPPSPRVEIATPRLDFADGRRRAEASRSDRKRPERGGPDRADRAPLHPGLGRVGRRPHREHPGGDHRRRHRPVALGPGLPARHDGGGLVVDPGRLVARRRPTGRRP